MEQDNVTNGEQTSNLNLKGRTQGYFGPIKRLTDRFGNRKTTVGLAGVAKKYGLIEGQDYGTKVLKETTLNSDGINEIIDLIKKGGEVPTDDVNKKKVYFSLLKLAEDLKGRTVVAYETEEFDISKKYDSLTIMALFVIAISFFIVLAFLVILSKYKTTSDMLERYKKNCVPREEVKSLGWSSDRKAADQFNDIKSRLGMNPTFWTYGNNGFAVWTLGPLCFDKKSVYSGLSEIMVRDAEVKHAVGSSGTHSDVVTVSADFSISEDRIGFVPIVLRTFSDGLYYDYGQKRLYSRCINLEKAVLILKHAIYAIFNVDLSSSASEKSLSILKKNMEDDWNSSLRDAKAPENDLLYIKSITQTQSPADIYNNPIACDDIAK